MEVTKEQVLGAISLMGEAELNKIWHIIKADFVLIDKNWTGVREVEPDDIDLAMIKQIEANTDAEEYVSASVTFKELGLE